jgi:hypothetical protein
VVATLVAVLVAVAALGACSESSGTTTTPDGQAVPEATLRPPSNTLAPGVTQLCASVVSSVVGKIVGPFHGAVPDSEYSGTTFAVILGASLNSCTSHAEWLSAAQAAAGGYRDLLDVVFDKACAAAKGNTTTGGSGQVKRPVPLPHSCRAIASTTTSTG